MPLETIGRTFWRSSETHTERALDWRCSAIALK